MKECCTEQMVKNLEMRVEELEKQLHIANGCIKDMKIEAKNIENRLSTLEKTMKELLQLNS